VTAVQQMRVWSRQATCGDPPLHVEQPGPAAHTEKRVAGKCPGCVVEEQFGWPLQALVGERRGREQDDDERRASHGRLPGSVEFDVGARGQRPPGERGIARRVLVDAEDRVHGLAGSRRVRRWQRALLDRPF